MKLGKALLILSLTIIAAGASIGTYFGVKDIIAENERANVPDSLFTMFGEDVKVTSFDDFSSPLIEYGASINGGSAYFYEVHSTTNVYGTIRFALGIEDGVVTDYLYLNGIDTDGMGKRGDNMAKENEDLFVDYSLSEPIPNSFAGVTITYNAMEDAVKAALTDYQERSAA